MGMAHPNTEIGNAARGRNLLAPPGDAAAFADAIAGLAENSID